MTNFKSRPDLERSVQGGSQNNDQAIGLQLLVEVCLQTKLLSEILVETKKVRNKLWNIEDCLSSPQSDHRDRTPEYEVQN